MTPHEEARQLAVSAAKMKLSLGEPADGPAPRAAALNTGIFLHKGSGRFFRMRASEMFA